MDTLPPVLIYPRSPRESPGVLGRAAAGTASPAVPGTGAAAGGCAEPWLPELPWGAALPPLPARAVGTSGLPGPLRGRRAPAPAPRPGKVWEERLGKARPRPPGAAIPTPGNSREGLTLCGLGRTGH